MTIKMTIELSCIMCDDLHTYAVGVSDGEGGGDIIL